MLWSATIPDFSMHLSIFLLIPVISGRVLPRGIPDEQTPEYIPCKEDWFFFEDKCYKVGGQNVPLTWEHASIYCKQEQGDLVTIRSKDLEDFLVTFLLLNVKTDVWIGLNDRVEDSKYKWSDGSSVTYLNWDEGEPSDDKKNLESCVEMLYFNRNGKGKWNDFKCDMKLPYICQSSKRKTSRNLDPRFCSNGKGGGWKHLNSCYHFVNERKSWEDSEKHCQNIFKGHLVTILDESAEIFIDYIMSDISDDFWIGIKATESAQQRWSSGWRVVFDRWDTSQAVFEEDLCALYSYGMFWRTTPCTHVHTFICETSTDKPPVEENWDCPSLSDQWINANGMLCYLLHMDKPRAWFEANYECMRKGGALASIRSAEEADVLYSVITNSKRSNRMYIGLHSNFSNKTLFEWIDGSEMNYQHWDANEPNSDKEDCGEMSTEGMRWNDIYCDTKLNFICSAKKVRPSVEENMHKIEESSLPPLITESSTAGATDCVCPICLNTTKETETEHTDYVSKLNPNVTEKTELKECSLTVPPDITQIIESALEEFSCPMNPNIMKTIESALKNYSDPSNSSAKDDDMVISNNEDSSPDKSNTILTQSNTSTEKMTSNTENDQTVPETNTVFIDTSILIPDDESEEKLYVSPSREDSSRELSQTESALVERANVKKTSVVEQQALLLQQRKRELELGMKFKVEEHKLRMSVLNAQLKLLNQISELIAENPEAIQLII